MKVSISADPVYPRFTVYRMEVWVSSDLEYLRFIVFIFEQWFHSITCHCFYHQIIQFSSRLQLNFGIIAPESKTSIRRRPIRLGFRLAESKFSINRSFTRYLLPLDGGISKLISGIVTDAAAMITSCRSKSYKKTTEIRNRGTNYAANSGAPTTPLWACGATPCGGSRPSDTFLSRSEGLVHAEGAPTRLVVA